MRARGRRLLIAAVALDAVAVVVLVIAFLVATFHTTLPGFALGAVDVPIVLAAAVLSGATLIRRASTPGRTALAWVATAVLTLASVPIGYAALGGASALNVELGPNPARVAAQRVAAPVEAEGGHRVCSTGDPGLGPDNVQPWYSAVYDAPADAALQQRLVARAEADGLTVGSVDDPPADRSVAAVGAGSRTDVDACGYGTGVRTASAGRQLVWIEVEAPAND